MSTPIHDWVKPRLDALLAEATGQGMDRLTVVAVMTDIIEGPGYNTVAPSTDDPINPQVSDIEHEPIATPGLPIHYRAPQEGGFTAE